MMDSETVNKMVKIINSQPAVTSLRHERHQLMYPAVLCQDDVHGGATCLVGLQEEDVLHWVLLSMC